MKQFFIYFLFSILFSQYLIGVQSFGFPIRKLQAKKKDAWDIDVLVKEANSKSKSMYDTYMKLKSKTQRIEFMLNLWADSDGLSLKLLVNKIINKIKQTKKLRKRLKEFHLALDKAILSELEDKVYEALARSFSIQISSMDSYGILAILEIRINEINKSQKDNDEIKDFMKKAGCLDIQEILELSEKIALKQGYDKKFIESLNHPDYMTVLDCYIGNCNGDAKECCVDEEAIIKGLCGCSDPNSRRCDYNILTAEPRIIWTCSSSECKTNQKCICLPQMSDSNSDEQDDYYS